MSLQNMLFLLLAPTWLPSSLTSLFFRYCQLGALALVLLP